MFISCGGFLTYAMDSHREAIKSNDHSVKNQIKWLVRATETAVPSSVTVGQDKDKHQAHINRYNHGYWVC